MITNTKPMTARIALDRTLWHAIRCAVGLHPWARWERLTATLTQKVGRTKTQQEIFVNARECIGCGIGQVRPL